MRIHPEAVATLVLGLGVVLFYLAATMARRVREAHEAQVEYDRRRAEAVLRALAQSREEA